VFFASLHASPPKLLNEFQLNLVFGIHSKSYMVNLILVHECSYVHLKEIARRTKIGV
jgi:hypothetical protein